MTITHRQSHTPTWDVWVAMRNRCACKTSSSYPDYGGRGIKVAERWEDYELFVADIGLRPTPNHSIERINVNGNYEPGNVRWATKVEQARNKRNSRFITANGSTKTLAEWAEKLGCQPTAITARLKSGMDADEAVSKPIPNRPNAKLDSEKAIQIYAQKGSRSAQSLADQFGVCKKSILNIFHKRTFADVT